MHYALINCFSNASQDTNFSGKVDLSLNSSFNHRAEFAKKCRRNFMFKTCLTGSHAASYLVCSQLLVLKVDSSIVSQSSHRNTVSSLF